jgi:conserved oligomeric Golgi complex subunit 4
MLELEGSVEEIRETLAELKKQDQAITQRLNALVASQNDLSRDLGKLDLIRAQLGTQAVATRAISKSTLSDPASTAKRISGAVQKLDLEQDRVKATLEVVEQVAELKACVLGVTGSMGAPQDWETAAGYLHRASKIPQEIICGSFAEEIVPSIEVPDPPNVTLENAAESLCGLFLREFEKATKEDNGAKVTRFFKLFPLIGRSEVGLNVYGNYVCHGVASQARSNLNAGTMGTQRKEGLFYASALTKLFEYIAGIVDRHGGLVERHYGEGRMVTVIERLQVEADVQGGIILDTWSDERSIDRKLTDIKSYAFTFLVQSFLLTQTSRNPISRTASPAIHDRSAAPAPDQEDASDMKDVDAFLNEIAIMLGRWSLYCRFLATKCADKSSLESPDATLTLPTLLTNSSLYKKTGDRLISPFNQMSTFFFRRSVEKAFQLDEQPTGLSLNMNKSIESNPPHISSAVDDVMYIVNQVVQRTLSTFQREVVASVLPTISRVLSADFVGMIQRKMRDESYPKPAVQGGLPPESTIVAFLVLCNNLDVATDYIKRIVSSKLEQTNEDGSKTNTIRDSFPFGRDSMFVHSTLMSLQTAFESKTMELLTDGIYVAFKNVMKVRLRPVMADTFRDMDYSLTQEQIEATIREAEADGEESAAAAAVASDAVRNRFQAGWEALVRPISRILTNTNFDRLLGVTASYLAEVLEKRIWGQYGRINGLGAVRLERDIAAIVGIVVRGGRYALRDQFVRCTQICLIMNMEEDEWDEILNQKGEDAIEWKLDADERERAKNMVR